MHQPNPVDLPLDAHTNLVLDTLYKGNKALVSSAALTKFVKHLHTRKNGALLVLPMTIATTALPAQWNAMRITPILRRKRMWMQVNITQQALSALLLSYS